MAWDLALSEYGDVIISGHRDLLGRSGSDLIEQRMRIRLLMQRGEWVFDLDSTLGSNLRRIIGMPPDQALQAAPAFVREALRDMDEIMVTSVNVNYTNHDVTVIVHYRLQDVADASFVGNEQTLSISLPVMAVSAYES